MRRALLVAALVLPLAGCSATVSLTPAPRAASVRCAGVVVRLAGPIGSAARRDTDAQGTAAWGDPPSVTMRCGVAQPAASTECASIGGVDWVADDATVDGHRVSVYTTFDRSPAVQIVIDPSVRGAVSQGDVLPVVSDAIGDAIPRSARRCTTHGS